MNTRDHSELVAQLHERAAQGAGLLELIDLVHDSLGVPRYNRGVLLGPFSEAFGLRPLDFTGMLFACEIFGGGASVPLAETERLFRMKCSQHESK